jgi:dUTP pyrophosphatase
MKLYVKKLTEDALLPTKAHDDDAGYDIFASESKVVYPGKWTLVPAGISIQMESDFSYPTELGIEIDAANMCAMVCSRSGLALKQGVFVLNAPGIIDEGYRGEVGVILCNMNNSPYAVNKGDKIAQLVFVEALSPTITEISNLESTTRGQGGFGSTDNVS